MADSIEVTLTLGYDTFGARDAVLHEYLTGDLGVPTQDGRESSGQHLDLVCGHETHPLDLPGSGQAGAVRIYAGCIRRGSATAIKEYLRAAPWGGRAAVLVVETEHDSEALVARLGAGAREGWLA